MQLILFLIVVQFSGPGPAAEQIGSKASAQFRILPDLGSCAQSDVAGEIVVCGRPDHRDSYRLEKLDPRFEKGRSPDERFVRGISGGIYF